MFLPFPIWTLDEHGEPEHRLETASLQRNDQLNFPVNLPTLSTPYLWPATWCESGTQPFRCALCPEPSFRGAMSEPGGNSSRGTEGFIIRWWGASGCEVGKIQPCPVQENRSKVADLMLDMLLFRKLNSNSRAGNVLTGEMVVQNSSLSSYRGLLLF